jgi:hypothetical protein
MPAKQNVSIQIKALQDDGSFEGILASYNNVDLGGDRILPGAFTKTIQERGSTIPLLWQHKADHPIGTLSLVDGPEALMVKGQLLMDIPHARTAYTLLKAKVIKGMSIGFDTIKDSIDDGVRILKELRLWEGSIVTFPMNEAAMVTSIKALPAGAEQKDDFNTELSQIQLQDAGYQMRGALFQALGSLVWASGITKEDKIAAAKTTIEQFSDAFMGYFPQYLDWLAGEYGDLEMMGRLQMEEKHFGASITRSIAGVKQVRALLAAPVAGETKEGRKFSAATKKTLNEAHEHVKGLGDIFDALSGDIADDDPNAPAVDDGESIDEDGNTDTVMSKAAKKTKTEPDSTHSAAAEILSDLRSLIPKA